MSKKVIFSIISFLMLFTSSVCFSDSSAKADEASVISVSLEPAVEIPLGINSSYFGTGGSLSLKASFSPGLLSFLSVLGEFNYIMTPYGTGHFFSSYGGGGGIGFNFDIGEKLSFRGFATGGYSSCSLELAEQTVTGDGAYYSGGIAGKFHFNPLLSVGVSCVYRDILGVYSGLSASVTASLDFDIISKPDPVNMGPVEGNYLKLIELDFGHIFPVFYSDYDDHTLGSVLLYNNQEKSVKDIRVSLFVNKYMDAPKKCLSIEELPAGESRKIDLIALFTENMLEITEGMKVATEIAVDYEYEGTLYRDSHTESMQIEFRNAMTWDDDRRAAAFVTAKDPDILSTSKNAAGILKTAGEYNINSNLLTAIAFHEMLRLYGMSYVIDPSTPYENLSVNASRVDYLQFPRETLEYRAGDCDDLSILYCALFESVGIETAFITVPGHIYMAFALGLSREEAEKTFTGTNDLIFQDDDTWVPLEVTCLEDDFLKAWQLGAKQWREYNPQRKTGFYRIHEAWKTYRPIGLPGRGVQPALPPAEMINSQLTKVVKTYVEQEIYPRAAEIKAVIDQSSGDMKIRNMNKLGVLYARYGIEEKAIQEFNKILLIKDYIPALINTGHLYYQGKNMEQALPYYEKVLKIDPDNKKALLYTALVNHELENYAAVEDIYSQLRRIDSDFAAEFAYLNIGAGTETRASDTASKQVILWEE